jgi:hypothetical protein
MAEEHSSISQISAVTTLELPIAGKKVNHWLWIIVYWHNLHTKFYGNWISRSRVSVLYGRL